MSIPDSEAEVQHNTLQPGTAMKAHEQQPNEHMNAAQDFYREIQEVRGEKQLDRNLIW